MPGMGPALAGITGLVSTALLVFAFSGVARPSGACAGCNGVGGTGSSSGGLCEGMLELTVVTERGRCDLLWDHAAGRLECRQQRGCSPVLTRAWRDLLHDVDVEHCAELGGRELCLFPRVSPDTHQGRTVRVGPHVPCNTAGAGVTFSVAAVGCGLGVKATVHCSSCRGRA
jgi:hypothetical protein